ncbi:hypothetical protein, partial [Pseudomonas sp. AMR01]|uniref:hypothetical protein n=1 Tax=Pseudomonas sp. AMR01 TaxID=3064904 RepID=UPI0035C1FD9B
VRIILDPAVEERWDAIKTMCAIMAAVMFVSIMYYSLDFTWDQRRCNTRVVDTQNYRAELANADRALNDSRDDAVLVMVRELLNPTPEGGGSRAALERYETRIELINQARDKNEDERRKNPLPRCDGVENG